MNAPNVKQADELERLAERYAEFTIRRGRELIERFQAARTPAERAHVRRAVKEFRDMANPAMEFAIERLRQRAGR